MHSAFLRAAILLSAGLAAVLGALAVPLPQAAAGSSDATIRQKLIVIYKSGATEEDKQRVRSLLKADVTARFNDPNTEELTVEIPKSCNKKRYIRKRIAAGIKDPAVQVVQVSASYKLN